MDATSAIQPVAGRRVPSPWTDRQPQVAPERLPQQVDLSPSHAGSLIICAAGMVMLVGTWEFVGEIAQAADPILAVISAALPLAGAGLLGWGLMRLYERRSVTFRESGVDVAERSLTGSRQWSAEYSQYVGVLQREHTIHTKNSSRTFQIIQLVHPDAARDLPLYVARGTTVPRAQWESLAERLRLPALQLDDDRTTARPPGALDAPLAEQVRAGRLPGGVPPHGPPPARINVKDDTISGGVRIDLLNGRIPLSGYMLFAMLALPVTAMSFLHPAGWPLAAVGVALLAGIGWVSWKDAASPRAITITAERVENHDAWRWNTDEARTLDIPDIEGVRIYRSGKAGSLVLVIESDRGSMHVGQGLSRADLSWLRDFLTAKIAATQDRRRDRRALPSAPAP